VIALFWSKLLRAAGFHQNGISGKIVKTITLGWPQWMGSLAGQINSSENIFEIEPT